MQVSPNPAEPISQAVDTKQPTGNDQKQTEVSDLANKQQTTNPQPEPVPEGQRQIFRPRLFTFEVQTFSCKAYPVLMRLLGLGFGLLSLAWFAQLVGGGRLVVRTSGNSLWFVAGLLLVLYTVWLIWRSETTLSSEAVRQSWAWEKKLFIGDIAFAKLVRVRGFEWLIAPRLYMRTYAGKMAAFYAADARMVTEFERLVQELENFIRR